MKIKRNIGTRLGMTGIVIGVAAAAVWGVAVSAGVPDANGVIHACFNRTSGAVRLIEFEDKCRTDEQRVSWNQAGVDTTPQISIILNADATIRKGTGFTSESAGEGLYRLEFPPGAFAVEPTVSVAPLGFQNLIAVPASVFVDTDGSGVIVIFVRRPDGTPVQNALSITVTK
jgi:hypothetical protein